MNKLKYILHSSYIALVYTLVACGSNNILDNSKEAELKFNKLTLNQRRIDDNNYWNLISPEAKYDYTRRIVKARNPDVTIFDNNKPKYKISSAIATVFNDGENIILEGDVKIYFLRQDDSLLYGDLLIWNPSNTSFSFQGRSNFKKESNTDTAGTNSLLSIYSKNIKWNSTTGNIQSPSTIRGLLNNYNNQSQQYIKANTIKGNTNKGYIEMNNCRVTYISKIRTNSDKCTFVWSKIKNDLIKYKHDEIKDTITNSDKIIPSATQESQNERLLFSTNKYKVESTIYLK